MSQSTCAVPSRPHISAENLKKHEVGDYTFPRDLAREWLGLGPDEMDELVERSQLNAARGLNGPLVVVNGGSHFTMESVFFTRRFLAY